jgi:hypothetical protein
MSGSTSGDLHPRHGGRFVFVRCTDEPLVYSVEVFLPAGVRLEGRVAFIDGNTTVDPAWPEVHGAWATEETLKLARVLKRTRPERIVRWRG